METPRMMDATLGPSNRYPITDALEVFQGNTPTGAFGLRNQQFGDDVVNIAGKSRFLLTALLEESLCGLSTLRLEIGPQSGMTMAQAVDLPAGVSIALRVRGNIDDSEVNAKPVFRFIGRRFGDIHDHGEIELAFTADEVNLSANVLQPSRLISAEDNGDKLPALEREDGNAVKAFPGQYSLVVDDGSAWAEGRLLGLVPLVRFAGLGNSADGQLRRQPELLPDVMVDDLLQTDLVSCSLLKSDLRNNIAGGVEAFHRLDERNGLFGRRLEFDHQCQVHDSSITQYRQYINRKGRTAIPPRIKTLGFLAVSGAVTL